MESEGSQTNGSAIDWYKNLTSCGKVSEEKIKAESVAFFMLSPEEKTKDKKMFKIRLEELVKMQRSTETSLMREVMKSNGGNGKQYVNPPEYFLAKRECVLPDDGEREHKTCARKVNWRQYF